jgi:hypothetical protein
MPDSIRHPASFHVADLPSARVSCQKLRVVVAAPEAPASAPLGAFPFSAHPPPAADDVWIRVALHAPCVAPFT